MRLIILVLLLGSSSLFGQDFSLSVVSQTDPSCASGDDGSIIVETSNGTAPISFVLDNTVIQDNGTFNDLSAGTYVVTATDADNQVVEISVTLSEPLPIALQIDGMDPSCIQATDGMITISEINNVSGVEYSISGPATATNTTGIFNDLGVGTYIISAATNPDCRVVISTVLNSDIECEEEDEELCPMTFSRVGMQINKIEDDQYNLRVLFKSELDLINDINYSELFEIVEFHILNRRVMLTEEANFKFENYCAQINSYRGNGNDSVPYPADIDYIDLNEIEKMRTLLAAIRNGECIKI